MARFVSVWPVLAVLAFAPAAFAQEDGVTYDPDSPAGSEYALPLDQARTEAAGGDTSRRPASGGAKAPTPLFGVGVETSGGSGSTPGSGSGSSAGSGSSPSPTTPAPPVSGAERAQVEREVATARQSLPSASSATQLTTGALVALIAIAASCALGIGVRRARVAR